MEKVTRFFYYYTLIALTILTIGSAFFLTPPFNIVYPLALLPSLIFFWLRLTDPVGATETTWSSRLVVVLVILIGLGLFGYYLNSQNNNQNDIVEVETEEDMTATLSAEIKQLKSQLEEMKQEEDVQASRSGITDSEISDLINSLSGTTPTPSSFSTPEPTDSGSVKVISNDPVNIYESNSVNSKISGIAEPDNEYVFKNKVTGWYLIEFENQRSGWIQAKEVVEFN